MLIPLVRVPVHVRVPESSWHNSDTKSKCLGQTITSHSGSSAGPLVAGTASAFTVTTCSLAWAGPQDVPATRYAELSV